jgi:hypothetical protein
VPGPSETPGSPEPSFAFDSPAPSTSPSPGKTLAPLRFATLKLVERPGSIEDILTGEFGWACPVQVPPPADLTAQALTKILAGPGTSPGLRKGFGFVVWAGTNPEDAAIAFGASLVVRDGAGDLWLLLRSGGTSVRHLERMLAADGTVAWWLTDAVAAGKCPDRSAPAGTRG